MNKPITRQPTGVPELVSIRRALADTCRREAIEVSVDDLEILELLLAGLTVSATTRVTGLNRQDVEGSRAKWHRVLTLTTIDPNLKHAI